MFVVLNTTTDGYLFLKNSGRKQRARIYLLRSDQWAGYNSYKMKVLPLLLLLFFVSCHAKNSSEAENQNKEWNDYLMTIGHAEMSNDEQEINSAIGYIDNAIEKGWEKNIFSVYYDKARLLFKLGKYNEALETLGKSKNNYDIQKAALLIIMGNDKEAKLALDDFHIVLKESLLLRSVTEVDIKVLFLISILSDTSFDDICSEYVDSGYIREEELNLYKNSLNSSKDVLLFTTKDDLLQSMWPVKTY